MTILVDVQAQNWMSNHQVLDILHNLPREKIRFYPQLGDPSDIRMLACDRLRPGLAGELPNLQLVQKMGAGVETMVNAPDLHPDVRIARIRTEEVALEMARFCIGYVLNDMQNMAFFRLNQEKRQWLQKSPANIRRIKVGVLGLGNIGGTIANRFRTLGFSVVGWSRTPKQIPGMDCRHGEAELENVLGLSDYVICILPSTRETLHLFDLDRFRQMKPGAMLVNVGRGSLINEQDLVTALDSEYLGHAVLDVFQNEPLAKDDPLWSHGKVTITPHVSGWHLESGLSVVQENYIRLIRNQPLLNLVDRKSGY